jgi:hypothetical protein
MTRPGLVLTALVLLSCHKEPAMTDNKTPPTTGSTGAAPVSTGVAFAATARGPTLEVAWTNNTAAPLKIATHVSAGEKHFDWITVHLTDGAGTKRRLRFSDDRDESGTVLVDVAPGATIRESIDLAAWANRKPNGKAPLASGTYAALVVYDSANERRGWQGHLEATTSVTLP